MRKTGAATIHNSRCAQTVNGHVQVVDWCGLAGLPPAIPASIEPVAILEGFSRRREVGMIVRYSRFYDREERAN